MFKFKILLLIMCVALAAPATAADLEKSARITVQGEAKLAMAPDLVLITIGVRTQAIQAREAARLNAEQMNKVLASLKAKLGPKDQVRTTGYRLNPRQKWDPKSKENKFLGFEASNQVLVKSRNVDDVSALLDAVIEAGANQIHGIQFDMQQAQSIKREVQALAFADAKAQADALAIEAGMRLGEVLRIDTKPGRAGYSRGAVEARMAAAPTPVEPGQVDFSASVICVFRLVKP